MSCKNMTQGTKIDCCAESTGLTCRKGCKKDGGGECVPDTSGGGGGFTSGACPSKGPVICDVGGTCEETSLEKGEPNPCYANTCWTPLNENTIKACNVDISRRRGGGGNPHPHHSSFIILLIIHPLTWTHCVHLLPNIIPIRNSKCEKIPHNWTKCIFNDSKVTDMQVLTGNDIAKCIINGFADSQGCKVTNPDQKSRHIFRLRQSMY